MSDQDWTEKMRARKRAWHERQRSLPLPEKIRILIELQKREREMDKIRAALGLPTLNMRVWDTEP